MKFKNILKEWNSFLKESEAFGEDPSNFDNSIFSRKTPQLSANKTNLNEEQLIAELSDFLTKYDKVFLSFVDRYDENIPRLSVNPKITYNTPHGVYGYPLTKERFYQFLVTGNPTSADFATDMPYFHVYLVKDEGKIKIKRDGSSNYDDRLYIKDAKTLIKVGLDYFVSLFRHNSEVRNLFDQNGNIDSFSSSLNYRLFSENLGVNTSSANSYFNFFADISGFETQTNIDDHDFLRFCRKIEDDAFRITNPTQRRRIENSRFHMLYTIAYYFTTLLNSLEIIAKKESIDLKTIKRGGLYTLLLSSINIKTIDDSEGSSTLHVSEPSQIVTINTTNAENIILLGTYKNHIYKSIENGADEDERDAYVISLIEKGVINSSLINFRNYDW